MEYKFTKKFFKSSQIEKSYHRASWHGPYWTVGTWNVPTWHMFTHLTAPNMAASVRSVVMAMATRPGIDWNFDNYNTVPLITEHVLYTDEFKEETNRWINFLSSVADPDSPELWILLGSGFPWDSDPPWIRILLGPYSYVLSSVPGFLSGMQKLLKIYFFGKKIRYISNYHGAIIGNFGLSLVSLSPR